MRKKRKTVRVGNIEVTPITPRERRRLDQRLKRRYARLRKQYPEIRGKRVDWIDFSFNDGLLYVGVRFMDATYFSLVFGPQIVTDLIEYSDMSSGDDAILKTYYRKKCGAAERAWPRLR